MKAAQSDRHRILMVSDFFYPNVGGVENHIYQLGQHLLLLGHKVVVVTHAYGDCRGVRHLTNGMKVYYLHRRPMYQQTTFPTFFGNMPLLRCILLRERISMVHAHQAFSTLALEALLHARTMGYPAVFTDHSLFGFADTGSILMNKALKCVLADVQHAVCVSHTSRENTVLRACLPPARVSVIPNAVDTTVFHPRASGAPGAAWPRDGTRDPVVLLLLSRLVYRKGMDLVALALPRICASHPNVQVLIGGGGPKARLLAHVVNEHGLAERVTLAGPVPSDRAADFLRQGHVFLNASLTEAFCMAIVEAAACGLLVVSTRVGGVPEVLPPHMVELAEPSAQGLCDAVSAALARVGAIQPAEQHRQVAGMYSWADVAVRTCRVYALAGACMAAQRRSVGVAAGGIAGPVSTWDAARVLPARLALYVRCGRVMGPLMCLLAVWLHWWYCMLCFWVPAATIDAAVDWPSYSVASDGDQI